MEIKPKKYLYWGAIILFLIAMPMHFIYEFTNIKIIGLLAPVNESIFEHLKLFSFPMLVCGLVYFFKNKHNPTFNYNNWWLSVLVWLLTTIILVLTLYYILSAGFGIESLPVDIISLLVSLSLGALMANHVYQYSNAFDYKISLTIIVIIILLFSYLSIQPPKLPLFKDNASNIYGFKKE